MKTLPVRQNILNLSPYQSARNEFTGEAAVFLDANENPFGTLNRYPDPNQSQLKQALATTLNIDENQIFIGNGSDEVIDLTFRIFCEPGQDKALICPPTYGMYRVSAALNNIALVEVPLTTSFQLNVSEVLAAAKREQVKVIWLCSPNNPTGNVLNDIEEILQNFDGLVFVDEAYIDFSEQVSWCTKIKDYPNLIVSQTFSKARGLANARVGIGLANAEIIALFNRVKPPYNVSGLNQTAALNTLCDTERFQQEVALLISERIHLEKNLKAISWIDEVYPSEANFILIRTARANEVYETLKAKGIVLRNRSAQIPNTIRISIGAPKENQLLLKTLKSL